MKKDIIIQDYYGGLSFIEENKDKELTIFIVDDHEVYLNLLKEELSNNPKFSIHTFTTGEKCLNYLELNPDLVILDYHLDGKHSYAQKGDVIYEKIKEKLPLTEIVIISYDYKLAFLTGLKEKLSEGVMFKDRYTIEKLKYETGKLLKKKTKKLVSVMIVLGGIVFVFALMLWIVIK